MGNRSLFPLTRKNMAKQYIGELPASDAMRELPRLPTELHGSNAPSVMDIMVREKPMTRTGVSIVRHAIMNQKG